MACPSALRTALVAVGPTGLFVAAEALVDLGDANGDSAAVLGPFAGCPAACLARACGILNPGFSGPLEKVKP